MLNIYCIYFSSVKTGDVELYDEYFASFKDACKNINDAIEYYVKENGKEKSYIVMSKDEFDEKKINKDSDIKVGFLIFKKKNSNAVIYSKSVVEGRLWNGSKVKMIGKIGVKEITINKFYCNDRIKNSNSNNNENENSEDKDSENGNDNNNNDSENDNDRDVNDRNDDSDDYNDNDKNGMDVFKSFRTLKLETKKPTYYEHGKHVSFIGELKNVLGQRSTDDIVCKVNLLENSRKNFVDIDQRDLIDDLQNTKEKLNKITPPPSPEYGLGRVVESNIDYDYDYDYDFPEEFDEFSLSDTERSSIGDSFDSYDSIESWDLEEQGCELVDLTNVVPTSEINTYYVSPMKIESDEKIDRKINGKMDEEMDDEAIIQLLDDIIAEMQRSP